MLDLEFRNDAPGVSDTLSLLRGAAFPDPASLPLRWNGRNCGLLAVEFTRRDQRAAPPRGHFSWIAHFSVQWPSCF